MTMTWLAAAHQSGNGPVLGRVVLVAVAMLAVGAFAVLQVKARSPRRRPSPPRRRRRRYEPPDWPALPPGYQPYPRRDHVRRPS
jgi:hypothetical protein